METILSFIGDVDKLTKGFGALILLDVATGVLVAWKQGAFTSKIGKNGAILKAGMILALIFAYVADYLFNTGQELRIIFTWIFIGFEGSSVLENLGLINVPIPKIIKDKFAVLKDKEGGQNVQ